MMKFKKNIQSTMHKCERFHRIDQIKKKTFRISNVNLKYSFQIIYFCIACTIIVMNGRIEYIMYVLREDNFRIPVSFFRHTVRKTFYVPIFMFAQRAFSCAHCAFIVHTLAFSAPFALISQSVHRPFTVRFVCALHSFSVCSPFRFTNYIHL